MALSLTQDQSRAANPNASAWVEASAGTGKTHVLTARVLNLLLAKTPPDRILALTFTKAAAAEMANRILDHLGRWAVMTNDDLRQEIQALTQNTYIDDDAIAFAKSLFAQVLDLPHGFNIQTIHAFCQSLLGRFPVESGLPPQFQVMDERTQDEILSATRDSLMGESRSNPEDPRAKALASVVTLAGEGQFNTLMAALLRERSVLKRLAPVALRLENTLKRAFDIPLEETPESLIHQACASPHFDGAGLKRAADALIQGSAKEAERGQALHDWLAISRQDRIQMFEVYTQVYLTNTGNIRQRLANKKTLLADPAIGDILFEEAERILQTTERIRLHHFIARSSALLRVGLALAQAFDHAKKRLGLADYDDLIAKTAELLNEQEMAGWVLYKLDGGIDHILIDEAQDTNPEQWRVVQALSDEFFSGEGASQSPRTIFAVGDVKQSIYGFQGAAPESFLKYQDHFRKRIRNVKKQFESVPLDLSFRSTDAVLALVDAVFEGEAGRGLSHSERQIRHIAHRNGHAGQVELWPTLKSEPAQSREIWKPPTDVIATDNPQARLATQLAQKIASWIGVEPLKARGRAMRAGDIMILVRRRTAFIDNLVSALKTYDVPIAGVDRFDLLSPIAVQDLLALAQFAVLPDDDLNLACVLKGPFVGLSEEQLFRLSYQRSGNLWHAVKASTDFINARVFLEDILNCADYTPPYEFFETILTQNSGRRALLARLGREAEEAIDEFLAQAIAFETNHTPALDSFLHWIHARASEVKRDPEQTSNAVRIMTVHGAKGLQAPVVILPDTCQVAKDDAPLLTMTSAEGLPFPVWYKRKQDQIGPIAEAKAAREAGAADEAKRLLYVALTRAEDRLVVTGWETQRGRSQGCWYDMIEAGFSRLSDCQKVDNTLVYKTAQRVPVQPDSKEATKEDKSRLPDWAKKPAPKEESPPRPLAPSRQEDGPAAISPLEGTRAHLYERGRIIHKLLQRLPDFTPDTRADAGLKFLAHSASHWPQSERDKVLSDTLSLIDNPHYGHLFKNGSMAEVPLSGIVGNKVISGQVDRLAITADSVIFADYKTNQNPPEKMKDVPRTYIRQMAAYYAVLKAIYPDHDVHAALIWTVGAHSHFLDQNTLASTSL